MSQTSRAVRRPDERRRLKSRGFSAAMTLMMMMTMSMGSCASFSDGLVKFKVLSIEVAFGLLVAKRLLGWGNGETGSRRFVQ